MNEAVFSGNMGNLWGWTMGDKRMTMRNLLGSSSRRLTFVWVKYLLNESPKMIFKETKKTMVHVLLIATG